MSETIIKLIVFPLISVLFVGASIFFPVEVRSLDAARDVHFGLPLGFVSQDQSVYADVYPYYAYVMDMHDVPTRISWGELFGSFVILYLLLRLLYVVYDFVYRWINFELP